MQIPKVTSDLIHVHTHTHTHTHSQTLQDPQGGSSKLVLGTSATKELAHAVARLEQTTLAKTSTGHCTGLQMSREDEGYFTGEQTTEERDLTGNHGEGGEQEGQVIGGREEDDEGISEEEGDDVGGRPPGSLTEDRFTHSTAESQPLPSDRVAPPSEPSVNPESEIASEEVPASDMLDFMSETLPNGMLGPDFPDYLSGLSSEAHVTPFPNSTHYADPSMYSLMQPVGSGKTFPTSVLGSKDELVTGMLARTVTLDTLEYDLASETGPRCKPASSQSAITVASTGIMNIGGQICDPPFHVDDSRHCVLYQHPDCKSYGGLYL